MLSKTLEEKLNTQIEKEAYSSQLYLAMASWAETNGYAGVSSFLYAHSDEERQHMLKIVHYVNERGGHALVPSLDQPDTNFNNLRSVFERILNHEQSVSQSINEIVDLCLKEKDHSTNNFMQWYVSEQMEEESLARSIIDKLDLVGTDSTGLYFFDREIGEMNLQH